MKELNWGKISKIGTGILDILLFEICANKVAEVLDLSGPINISLLHERKTRMA